LNIFDELAWRGLVHQTSDEPGLREHLATPGRVLYCGFDPTADSLHIGNLVPLLALARFARAGHKPLFLLGGATGRIGDPSGKDKERQLKPAEVIEASAERIKAQAMAFFDRQGVAGAVSPVNNYDWIREVSLIEFLRDTGKHFTVNYMLAKDSVKSRIAREETGISYTEFSYMMLQAYDFHHLHATRGCTLQIGGGDQFGNITAGLELIRRKAGSQAYALTFPLITTASGAKFGKSEKGAIYLDPALTSPYAFYQYWINADDRDVANFLRYFTYLSKDDIAALEVAVAERPHLREAQKTLAREVTTMIHGADELAKVEAVTAALFGGGDLRPWTRPPSRRPWKPRPAASIRNWPPCRPWPSCSSIWGCARPIPRPARISRPAVSISTTSACPVRTGRLKPPISSAAKSPCCARARRTTAW